MAEKIQGDDDMGDGSGKGWIGGCAAALAGLVMMPLMGFATALYVVARWLVG